MSTSIARLLAVNSVHKVIRGPSRYTAIDKRPADGPVEVGELGLVDDRQCDSRHHGGADKALYAYAREDADWWAAELDREIRCGMFGENLTTRGLDVTHALIGERWRIGDRRTGILVEVTEPRTPCANLSAWIGIPKFHKRFFAHGAPGAYLRVLRPGRVRAGDPIRLEHRPVSGKSIADLVRR